MKNNVISLTCVLSLFGFLSGFYACARDTREPSMNAAHKQLYQCAMHPQIISEKPGECPICHMNLVPIHNPVYDQPADAARGVMVTQGVAQRIGMTVAPAQYRTLSATIRAAAKVAYDPALYAATIEHQEAMAFMTRAKSQDSQELMDQAESTVRASRLRLRQMGLSDNQIAQMNGSDDQGSSLLLGSAQGRLWVYASVFDVDASLLHPGLTAQLTSPALPGEVFTGTVQAVDPILDVNTRTVRVRIAVKNSRGLLKPEMYLSAILYAPLGRRLAVPEEAVLDTGTRQLVYVEASSGTFVPRDVRVGKRAQGYQEIISGLAEGETVATAANFLIDSESRIQATTAKALANP